MNIKTHFRTVNLCSFLTIGLSACGGGSDETGRLSLSITDAAVDDAQSVIVQFSGVDVKPASGPAISFNFPEIQEIDLLAYQGSDAAVLLDDVALPAGNYNWIRLDVLAESGVLDSRIILNDDSSHSLTIPSGNQTGLQVNRSFTVSQNGNVSFTLDFDLRKSVIMPQGQDDYRLKPTLRIVDNLEVGSIGGSVAGALLMGEGCGESGAVYVYEGADATVDDEGSANAPLTSALISLAEDNLTYQYEVGFLEAGDYTLAMTCTADLDDSEQDDDLSFVATQNATVTVNTQTTADFN